MAVLFRMIRGVRRAASRLGLLADRTRTAARAVERLLDSSGRDLFLASGVPGLSVLVRFAGGPEVRRSFGTAGVAGPMTTDTVCQVLSLSKPVTAMCALALVERKVLALDEPVWGRIRSWSMPPQRAPGIPLDQITLRRLLSHAAGFSSVEPGFCEGGERPSATDLLLREDTESQTLRVVAPPGTTYRYAPGGFVLAELLVEDSTGAPFPSVARERVLQPLGMQSSAYLLTPALAARLATPHDEANRALPQSPMKAVAASGLYTTAEDLATFFAALAPGADGELPGRGAVSPASCAEMLSPQSFKEAGAAYGLGLYVRSKRSDVRYSHSGHHAGWYCHADGFLRRRVVVVLLSNGDRGRACIEPLIRELRLALYDVAL